MTLRHLQIFVSVCDCGSISGAAKQMHISQPPVSQAISELEKQYHAVLFHRISHRLVLSEQGKLLLEKAREIVSGIEEFEKMALLSDRNPSVKIGATLTVGTIILPILLKRMNRDFPNAEPFFSVKKGADIEEEILTGALDFGIVEGTVSSPLIEQTPLWKDRLAIVCGKDYPMPDSICLSELPEYRLFLREEGSSSRKYLESVLLPFGKALRPVMISSSNSVILSSVLAGLGAAVLPYELVLPYLKEGIIKEIVCDAVLERNITLILHKNKVLTDVQRQIISLCKKLKEEEQSF